MNQMPQATAFEINPSDLIPKASRRKDWFAHHPSPKTRKETKEVVRVYLTAPKERVWTRQQDSHVGAWLEWKANEPVAFLKLRCREIDVHFSDVIGGSAKRIHSDPRGMLMAEVRIRYPNMSLPQIGRLFGGRDHSTVRTALIKHGLVPPRKTAASRSADIDRVKTLFAAGHTYREIGEAIGYSATTVTEIIKERGWRREPPARGVASHAAKIREMIEAGASLKAIAKAIGHSRSSVRAVARKQGWTR